MADRIRVLTFVDYYLPGYKAGGPINAIRNLAAALADRVAFRIVTRDRDLGDTSGYDGVDTHAWHPVGAADVFYLPPSHLTPGALRKLVHATPHDAIYLNSFFSVFTVRVLLLRRLGLIPRVPVLLAPRGELAASALRRRALRKQAYISFVRMAGLVRDVVWHASSPHEERQVSRLWSGSARAITMAPELPTVLPTGSAPGSTLRVPGPLEPKRPGELHIVFVARIARVKNLDGVLRALQASRSGRMRFDIYGPVEDPAHWRECEQLIGAMPKRVEVRCHGPVEPERLPDILGSAHVYVLASHGENFGHSIIEALAAGCPVLISDQTPWIDVEDRGAGRVIRVGDPTPWTAAFEQFAALDDDQHAALREAARAYALAVAADPHVEQVNRRLFAELVGNARADDSASGSRPERIRSSA
jgi:glycosyltransferase involved in cell wall biosynthesis